MSTHRYVPWGPVLSSASGQPARLRPVRSRCCVRLPLKARERFDVLVDGRVQVPGCDYEVVDRLVVFARLLPAGRRRGLLRRPRPAVVEVRYELDGHRLVARGLEPEPL